jgi:hypothetical protein
LVGNKKLKPESNFCSGPLPTSDSFYWQRATVEVKI